MKDTFKAFLRRLLRLVYGTPFWRRASRIPLIVSLKRYLFSTVLPRMLNTGKERDLLQIRVEGGLLCLDPRTEGYPLMLAMYEPMTTSAFKRLARAGDTIVDAGAHVGYYTLLGAKTVGPAGRVLAIEPNPATYELLLNNVRLNGYTNVLAINKAVSNAAGRAELHLSRRGGSHSLLDLPAEEATGRSLLVQTATLDECTAAANPHDIALIMIDIEGAEPLALEGMSAILAHASDDLVVIMELNLGYLRGSALGDLLATLAGHGFSCLRLIDDTSGTIEALSPADVIARTTAASAYGHVVFNLVCARNAPRVALLDAPAKK